ncbi:MAG TPA: adenylosuccinate lyase [Candidatus Dormibacteraeota bacterium]
MIERYAPAQMRQVFTDQRRFELWLQIEILVAEAWSELGRVPADALPAIRRGRVDVERIQEIEERRGHDVIAFLEQVGETIGPESRYVHLGLTSSDVIDTAFALQLREAGELIRGDLAKLREAAAELALRHRSTVMIGRTHGIHAEPITFGLKVAGWVAELDRALRRLSEAIEEVSVGKLSGAVGTHATIDPRIEERVCASLGLAVDPVSTQIVSRDHHAAYMAALAVIAGTLERIATEIRHLQRSEVAEAFEPFGREQKGSSAMPHKRNPVLTERVCGLARTVRGYAATALENQALWHERDISHSSAERVIFPDACCLVDYMTITLTEVVSGLEVDAERMRANLDLGGGVVFSQRVLLALVDAGMSREDAYLIVQSAAHSALRGEGGFRDLLQQNDEVRNRLPDLSPLFDPQESLKHIEVAFDRLQLGVKV